MHNFRDKRYKVVIDSKIPGNLEGMTVSPKVKHKFIKIDNGLAGLHRLNVIIHESLHACIWDMDEEAIDETASSVASLLWKLGYRKEN